MHDHLGVSLPTHTHRGTSRQVRVAHPLGQKRDGRRAQACPAAPVYTKPLSCARLATILSELLPAGAPGGGGKAWLWPPFNRNCLQKKQASVLLPQGVAGRGEDKAATKQRNARGDAGICILSLRIANGRASWLFLRSGLAPCTTTPLSPLPPPLPPHRQQQDDTSRPSQKVP